MGRDSGIGSVGGTVGLYDVLRTIPLSMGLWDGTGQWDRQCWWDCRTVRRPKDHPTVHGTVGWDGTVG